MIVLFLAFDAWLIRYMLRAASYVCSCVTMEKLQVWRVPTEASQALAKLAERSMQLQATVQEGALTLSNLKDSVHLEVLRWK